jgi:hypothetical protein
MLSKCYKKTLETHRATGSHILAEHSRFSNTPVGESIKSRAHGTTTGSSGKLCRPDWYPPLLACCMRAVCAVCKCRFLGWADSSDNKHGPSALCRGVRAETNFSEYRRVPFRRTFSFVFPKSLLKPQSSPSHSLVAQITADGRGASRHPWRSVITLARIRRPQQSLGEARSRCGFG